MARAYSLNLREKVMEFVANGVRKLDASKIFGVDGDSAYRWLRRKKLGFEAKNRMNFPS